MTTNRDKKHDREETIKLILNPNRQKYAEGKNWLGHGIRGGKDAYVDEMLLDGAMMTEMLKQRGAIYEHFGHLKTEHGLHYEKVGEKYRFDRTDLGISDQEEKIVNLQKGDAPNDTNESVFGTSSDTSGKEMRGAGFGDYETNQKVEQSAISFVTKWYQSHGWTVHSVEAEKCGFDLHCVLKADEEHVEVKGIQGERQSFLITTSEVRQAENNPRFVLCIVTSALSDQAMMRRFTGKEFLDIFKLEPLVFKASVRPNTGRK